MKIKVTSVYVDDQDKAQRFYTEVLGFAKKTDFSQGPYRWLTVASPEEPDGTELQLALNNNPTAKAYQQALFQQSQPAAPHEMKRRSMLCHSVRRVPSPKASSSHRVSLYSSSLGASARVTVVSVTRGVGAPTVVSFTVAPTVSRLRLLSKGAHSRS